jgi:hypothetical protein
LFSEHGDTEGSNFEDFNGGLSMWRAYARSSGVAVVIKGDPFISAYAGLGVYSSPVAYLNSEEFAAKLENIVSNMEQESAYVDTFHHDRLKSTIINMFRFAVLSTKHPGFKEEREWQLLHTPGIEPDGILIRDCKIIDGVPQYLQNSADQ